jgi:hypothetical protein
MFAGTLLVPRVAVMVAVTGGAVGGTATVVIANSAVVAFGGTSTVAGTCTF